MEDIIATAYELYERELASRSNRDYEVNQEQMDKFTEAYNFFVNTANKCNGDIAEVSLKPKEIHGGLTCEFTVFHLFGDQLREFSEVVKDMSALSIDAKTDGTVCISFTVPNVFKRK